VSDELKVIAFADFTKGDLRDLASYLDDDAHDMRIDEDEQEDESVDGHTLVACLRGLSMHLEALSKEAA
jgi:hypothetical protein